MAYVRNTWYVAQWSTELPMGTPQATQILGEPIVLWRNDEGQVSAIEDRCVHRLAPLSLGRVEQGNLRCMYHGFLFNPQGQVISIVGQDSIPAKARVKCYPVVEQDSWIWVWMGSPERADPALIPRVNGIDHPEWALDHGTLDYAAEASLINDNLTDLSHVAFVHAKSFSATETFAESLPTVTAIDRGVRIERWAENEPPLGKRVGDTDPADLLDVFLSTDYLVPGILRLRATLYPAGTFKRHGRVGLPAELELKHFGLYSAQAVTPTGKGTARYFFSNGPRAPAPAAVRAFLWNEVVLKAFAEDRIMIEGQQRVIDLTPDPRILLAVGDQGTVMFNRLVDRLVQQEAQADAA